MRQGEAGAHSGLYARRERVLESLRYSVAVEVSPRPSLCFLPGRTRVPGRLPAGGVEHGDVRRQLELAGTDLDASQRVDHSRADPDVSVLRPGLQSRMSHWFGQIHDTV